MTAAETAARRERVERTAWRVRQRHTMRSAHASAHGLEPVDLDVVGWRGDPAELVAALDADRAELFAVLLPPAPAWHADAACREYPRDWWFPQLGESTRRAVEVCQRCPVRGECLDEALADPELDHGIRGGLAPRKRAAMRRRRAASGA